MFRIPFYISGTYGIYVVYRELELFHAPLAFPIIQGLQVNPLGSNPITVLSMTSLVKYSLLLREKMERAPPYIIVVKSLESVAFRRLLQDNKNITTADNTVV